MFFSGHLSPCLIETTIPHQAAGKPVWDKQFVYGNVLNSTGVTPTYMIEAEKEASMKILHRTKVSIAKDMRKRKGAGCFYTQHALLLLSDGGCAKTLLGRTVTGVHAAPCLGDGAHRLLGLLAKGHPEFCVKPTLTRADFGRLALLERLKWRRDALQVLREDQLPFCLQKEKSVPRAWVAIPESFGDLLCEGAQVLRQLLGRAAMRSPPPCDALKMFILNSGCHPLW